MPPLLIERPRQAAHKPTLAQDCLTGNPCPSLGKLPKPGGWTDGRTHAPLKGDGEPFADSLTERTIFQ